MTELGVGFAAIVTAVAGFFITSVLIGVARRLYRRRRGETQVLCISGSDVGAYRSLPGDALLRPINDRDRAIWYLGYARARRHPREPVPTAGIPDGEGDE